MKLTRRASVALLVAVPMVLATGAGFAGAAPTTPNTTQLANSAAPGLEFATRTGAVAADSQLQVAVSLNYRDQAGLDAFLARLNNPSSADYHHYLTPQQFRDRFAPTQAQVDQVRAYLEAKGLTVTAVADNRMLIDAKGPAKTVQSAFATSVSRYHDNKLNKDFTANDTAPSVDASVAGLIGGISGLNNHYQLHSYTRAPQAGAPKVGSGPAGGYTAQELRSAYGVDKLVSGGADGTGQSIAMLEFSHFSQTNISTYDQQYATGSPTPTVVKVDGGDDDTAGGGVTEVELDIEVAHAIAPKAGVAVYEAPNSDQGEIDMWNKFVTDNVSVVSSSWGACELDDTASTETAVDNVAKQGAAQGQTFLSAAGDSGAYDCYRHSGTQSPNANNLAVDFPGSDPYVTSVGGTSLTEGSGGSYAGETVWNEGTATKWAGGGGVSSKFARPSWQTGPGVSTSSLRQVPDVSANAQNYSIYSGGSWGTVGGTSAATPFWASVLTLANQQAVKAGHAKVGQVNSTLYQLGSSSSYGTLFHDITSGDNLHYSAAANFDEASGWGSPKADALVPNLAGGSTQPGAPSVTNPGNQSNLVGDTVSITAHATGGTSPYTWTASGLPTGLSIASGTGVISGKTTTAGTYSVTVTATDAAGKTGSASFSWNVGTTGGSCSGQKLGNPGFETGSASPWTTSTGVVSNASAGEAAHSGSYLAWLDGYGTTHTDTLSQSVTIPAGCHATLTFWLHIDTAETTTTTQYDKLTVKAGSTTLRTFSNLDAASGYAQQTFDVSALAGQTVTISFTGAEDSGLQTSFVIDDTAVTLS